MKTYRQPKAGTPDAMKIQPTKIVNNNSNPTYQRVNWMLDAMKNFYKGNVQNEW